MLRQLRVSEYQQRSGTLPPRRRRPHLLAFEASHRIQYKSGRLLRAGDDCESPSCSMSNGHGPANSWKKVSRIGAPLEAQAKLSVSLLILFFSLASTKRNNDPSVRQKDDTKHVTRTNDGDTWVVDCCKRDTAASLPSCSVLSSVMQQRRFESYIQKETRERRSLAGGRREIVRQHEVCEFAIEELL